MTSARVPRWWAVEDAYTPIDGDGFLALAERPGVPQRSLAPLEALRATPCLVMLGPAGAGKSTELAAEHDVLKADGGVVLVRARSLASAADVHSAIFSRPELRAHAAGHRAVVLIDAFDEARDPDAVSAALVDALDALGAEARERLSLRVSCRTSARSSLDGLAGQLRQLWPAASDFEVRHLAPLRWSDVEVLARHQLGPAAAADFLASLQARRPALAFATSPHTLGLLLRLANEGVLTESERALYERGCLDLCKDRPGSPSRLLTPQRRLALAARIAAMTILTGRALEEETVEDVLGEDLANLDDGRDGARFDVTRADVEEVWHHTGLFENSEWVHPSYAEHLVARRLAQHPRPRQVLARLEHGSGAGRAVVPRLRGVASWLAVYDADVRAALLASEPELLLMTDVMAADEGQVAELVSALLARVRLGRLFPGGVPQRGLERVAFSAALELVWQAASDPAEPEAVRQAALHLAVAAPSAPLASRLVDLALDGAVPERVRAAAIRAVARWGSGDDKRRLLPLALRREADPEGDPQDELKGEALRAVWPGVLTDRDLFEALVPVQSPSWFGAYRGFMHFAVLPRIRELTDADVVGAIAWAGGHLDPSRRYEVETGLRELVDAVLQEAWRRIPPGAANAAARGSAEGAGGEIPPGAANAAAGGSAEGAGGAIDAGCVSERLAALVLDATRRHHDLRSRLAPGGWRDEHTTARRAVLTRIVEALTASGRPEDATSLMFDWTTEDDATWLEERLVAATSSAERDCWARLARCVLLRSAPYEVFLKRLLDWCERWPELREVFRDDVGPVPLDSPRADGMRGHYSALISLRDVLEERAQDPPEPEPLARMRDARRHGERAAWLTLTRASWDVAATLWWASADEATRREVLDLAASYLADPPAEREFVGSRDLPASEVAGRVALTLLTEVEPGRVNALTQAQRDRWAGVLLTWGALADRLAPLHLGLLERLSAARVAEVAEAELRSRDLSSHPTLLSNLERVWSEPVARVLLQLFGDDLLCVDDIPRVVALLLAKVGDHAVERALALVEAPDGDPERAARVAAALCDHDAQRWDRVWAAVTARPEVGRAFVAFIANRFLDILGLDTLHARLGEDQLAGAYLWLAEHAPEGEGRAMARRRAVAVTSDLWIDEWRDRLITTLRDRGTDEAVAALRRIQQARPDDGRLTWTIAAAEARARDKGWSPLAPAEVRALLAGGRPLVVADADDLFERALEALQRLQDQLAGHGPRVKEFWELRATPTREPKAEPACNDVLATRLADAMRAETPSVTASPEEQLRLSWGPGTGMRPDFVLRATSVRGRPVGVAFECKREDHPAVATALASQLVAMYLDDPACGHGIYVVYWFGLGKGPLGADIKSARATLAAQAQVESTRAGKRVSAVVLDATMRAPAPQH